METSEDSDFIKVALERVIAMCVSANKLLAIAPNREPVFNPRRGSSRRARCAPQPYEASLSNDSLAGEL